MYAAPVLATLELPKGTDGSRVPLTLTVTGGLHAMRGKPGPYFSLTYDLHRKGFPEQCYEGGAGHQRIAQFFGDRFADLAALHMADIDGVPLHAEANGWYWLAGALGGAGERYHGGNSTPPRTPAECLAMFARHARISIEEAEAIRDECYDEYDFNPDGWPAARALMALRLNDLRPRWKAQAEAAIAKHGLVVYGDAA